MKQWLPEFTPILRLLTVFGIGTAGVQAVLHRGQEPAAQTLAKPGIHLVDAALGQPAPHHFVPPPDFPAANIANQSPLPNNFSPIELSEALFAELSRGTSDMTRLARFEGVSLQAAVPPPPDPLFSDHTAMAVEDTGRFDDPETEVAARLADDLTAQANAAARPLAYSEPATGAFRKLAAFGNQPPLSSPAASGY